MLSPSLAVFKENKNPLKFYGISYILQNHHKFYLKINFYLRKGFYNSLNSFEVSDSSAL